MHRCICIYMRKFNMNLPEDLHKRLKHYCVDHNTEMGEGPGGCQYIVIAAGGHGKASGTKLSDAVIAYALP